MTREVTNHCSCDEGGDEGVEAEKRCGGGDDAVTMSALMRMMLEVAQLGVGRLTRSIYVGFTAAKTVAVRVAPLLLLLLFHLHMMRCKEGKI